MVMQYPCQVNAYALPELIDCNSGSLSVQAGLALPVAGWENLRILQGGFEQWLAKGGLDAHTKAAASPTR